MISFLSPYIRLMRLEKPAGIFLLMWPGWWSITMAAEGFDAEYFKLLAIFGLGAVIMRSAGCIINDIIDRRIDAKIERTKSRPLASGELNLTRAFILLGVLLCIGLVLLVQLNRLTIIIGAASLTFVAIYPLMKRVTYFPQVFLAITFNIGAIMGWTAITSEIELSAIYIYIAAIFWTLGYDTIYAHQDKKDDKKAGVKSTALKFGKNTKIYVSVFYTFMIGFLLLAANIYFEDNIILGIGLALALLQLFWQINRVNLDNSEDCMKKFSSNKWLGGLIFVSIVFNKLVF